MSKTPQNSQFQFPPLPSFARAWLELSPRPFELSAASGIFDLRDSPESHPETWWCKQQTWAFNGWLVRHLGSLWIMTFMVNNPMDGWLFKVNWLVVVYLPLWKMMDWKSVGMMTFPILMGKIIHSCSKPPNSYSYIPYIGNNHWDCYTILEYIPIRCI
jgi:hypothetical protein